MNARQFARFVERDNGCIHCGATEAIVPHHRANRGSGGSKIRDVPSNIVTLCSQMNFLLEADAAAADLARRYGWKLSTFSDPKTQPIWHAVRGQWLLLDDEFNTIVQE